MKKANAEEMRTEYRREDPGPGVRGKCLVWTAAALLTVPVYAAQDVEPPRAHLLYMMQEAARADYQMFGFPGCVPPGWEVFCMYADSTSERVARATQSGSFEFVVPYHIGHDGFSIAVKSPDGTMSPGTPPRLDYPVILPSSENELGWFSFGPVGMSETLDSDWMETWDAYLEKSEPEDLKVFGSSPVGDTFTCIVGANGRSFSTRIRPDRGFRVIIPHEAIEVPWRGDPVGFIANITNDENELLAFIGFDYMFPKWAHEKMQKQFVEALVNTTATDFELPVVGGEGTIALSQFKGEPTLIYFWATWCGPCLKYLPTLDDLYSELGNRGILLVSTDRDADEAASLLAENGYSIPTALDSARTAYETYKNYSVPMSVLIDGEQKIQEVVYGSIPVDELRRRLE